MIKVVFIQETRKPYIMGLRLLEYSTIVTLAKM